MHKTYTLKVFLNTGQTFLIVSLILCFVFPYLYKEKLSTRMEETC